MDSCREKARVDPMRRSTMLTRLKHYQEALAKERDKLRDFKEEIDALDDVSERALESLNSAIETLSEQV